MADPVVVYPLVAFRFYVEVGDAKNISFSEVTGLTQLDSAKFFVLRGRWHKKEHPSDKRAQNVRDWLKYQTISQVHYGVI